MQIEKRVIQTAELVLQRQHYVSPIDVFLGVGWLQPNQVQDWKKGKIAYLEAVIQGSLEKISHAMKCFRNWANQKGLKPSRTEYFARSRGATKELQFSRSNHATIENAYRTHYVSSILSEKKRQRLQEKLNTQPDLIVYIIVTDSQCSQCKKELLKGSFLFVETDKPLCLTCAGFNELVFLQSGDAKLTRNTKKYSAKCIIVVKFSRSRKRYERQGILVEQQAIQKAQDEGLRFR